MEQPTVIKVELHNRVSDSDPVPCFATRTEIEIAGQLRLELEQRLLAPSTLPLRPPPLDVPEEPPHPDACYRHGGEQP